MLAFALTLSAIGMFGKKQGRRAVLMDHAGRRGSMDHDGGSPIVNIDAMLAEARSTISKLPKPSQIKDLVVDPTTLPHCKLMMATTGDVVMGMASGYSWEEGHGGSAGISHFVRSLRNTGYTGKLLLGVKRELDPITKTKLEENCVFSIDASVFDATYLPNMPVASRRFPMYSSWIKLLLQMHQTESSNRILLCDIRDTLFQRSPFRFDLPLDASGVAVTKVPDLLFFGDSHPGLTRHGDIQGHTYLVSPFTLRQLSLQTAGTNVLRKTARRAEGGN
jgi:hypothetical protein